MDKFVTLGSFKNVQGTRLKDIRAMLNSENGLSVRLYVITSPFPKLRSNIYTKKACRQGSPFCNKVGAVANENLHFTEYIKSLDRGGTKSEEEKKEESDKQGYSTQVVSTVVLSHVDVTDDYDSPAQINQSQNHRHMLSISNLAH